MLFVERGKTEHEHFIWEKIASFALKYENNVSWMINGKKGGKNVSWNVERK